MNNRAEVNGPLAPTVDRLTPNGAATDEQSAAATVIPASNIGRTERGTFAKGNRGGPGRPRKGESIPEKLKARIEKPRSSDAIVEAVYRRLLREDAVGNRAFADVRDTVYGIPKQTLVLEQGESPLAALLREDRERQTVEGESRLLEAGESDPT